MWGLGRPALFLFVIGLVMMGAWLGATRWRPSSLDYPLQGLDLPLDAGPADWGTVRGTGADFAYLVATAGRRRGAGFEANWAALPEAGLRRGAVHLFSPCEPAEAQANAFNVVVPRTDDALPAAVDVDLRSDDCPDRPDAAAVIAGLRRFVAMVETHTGRPVLLRVSRAAERNWGVSAAIDRPVWALGNLVPPGYPARPWRMWRASNWHRVDGIEGPVNWDVVAS